MHLRLAQASAALAAGALLTLSGPAAAGTDGWTRGGPWGGEISALAADPGAAGVVYAGAGRALFRSPDGGASWERTATFSDVPLTVAVDRDHVIYAGVSYAGIRRSVDGGANWQPVGTGLPTSFRYAIGPSADGRVLYAGTIEHGVWRIGADGGSWTPANGGAAGASIAQLSVDPRSSDRLAARTVDGQVLRSADGGATWSPVQSGATDLLRPADDPGSLLAAREGSLAVSDDGGEFAGPGVLAPRTRAPIEGVLEHGWDRAAVLGRHEHDAVGRCDLRLEADNARRKIAFVVLVVERQIVDLNELELQARGAELGQRLGELAVDGFAAVAADDQGYLELGHGHVTFCLLVTT